MKVISVKKRKKRASTKEKQEKLDILTRDFEKLEENWKEYIRELIRKLADIHREGELMGINTEIDSVSVCHISGR